MPLDPTAYKLRLNFTLELEFELKDLEIFNFSETTILPSFWIRGCDFVRCFFVRSMLTLSYFFVSFDILP